QPQPLLAPPRSEPTRLGVFWKQLREEQSHRAETEHEHALDAAPIDELQSVNDARQWLQEGRVLGAKRLGPREKVLPRHRLRDAQRRAEGTKHLVRHDIGTQVP